MLSYNEYNKSPKHFVGTVILTMASSAAQFVFFLLTSQFVISSANIFGCSCGQGVEGPKPDERKRVRRDIGHPFLLR